MTEGEEKTQVKEPKLPERQFLDKLLPHERLKARLDQLFRNRLLWGALILLTSLMTGAYFFFSSPAPKQSASVSKSSREEPKVERSESFTQQALERAIDTSAKDLSQAKRKTEVPPQVFTKKRTFKSGIAAFIYKEEAPKTSYEKKEALEIRLGLPSGTKIPALLENRIFSFNVAAPVLAFLPKDVLREGKVVIPKDSKFLGEANVLKSVDRINVRFDLLIFPDGREMRVRAMALSEDGSAGIAGKVEKHGDVKVLKAIGETLLAGASLFVGGTQTNPISLEDEVRLNLARNLTNQAEQDLRAVKVEKSVTVDSYVPILIILLEAT
jgi:hypothetical protein